MPERPFIYRFTDDLRLDDHAGLAAAASRGPVIPVIVIDDAMRERISASPRRGEFFCAAVRALFDELEQRGSHLVVRRGEPEVVLPRIARETGASGVAWSASYDRAGIERDRRTASELEEAGWTVLVEHDAPVISPEESAAAHSAGGSGYRAFAPYFDVWLKLPVASHEHPLLLRFLRAETEKEPLPGTSSAQARPARRPAQPSPGGGSIASCAKARPGTRSPRRRLPTIARRTFRPTSRSVLLRLARSRAPFATGSTIRLH
jgi:deoxyribodipyrimidine photolyase